VKPEIILFQHDLDIPQFAFTKVALSCSHLNRLHLALQVPVPLPQELYLVLGIAQSSLNINEIRPATTVVGPAIPILHTAHVK
jgi:hypothetical protein